MLKGSIGIILKSIPYSESSIISRIFTPNFGKISIISRGAKKANNGKFAMLEPMNIVEFQMNFNESKDLHTLHEISIKYNLSKIRTNIKTMALGLVMIEILDKTSHQSDPAPILYRLLESSIIKLNNPNNKNRLLFIFYLLQFSKYSGFSPVSNNCHNCENELSSAFYNIKSGFLDCKNCQSVESLNINSNTFLLMKKISKTHIKSLNEIEFFENTLELIKKYLIKFMEFHIHGMQNIKSLTFLNSIMHK